MAIGSRDLIDRLTSHAYASGFFDRVTGHEPKSKPGRGLSCAVWIDRIEPARSRSALTSTAARVVFNVRVYTNMMQQPQDEIDPSVMDAVDYLFEAYTGDFELGGSNRFIDVLGMTQGHALDSQSGYINIDNMTYRVMTISVPVIVNDAWTQAP
jgi:hypothetical protein